MSELRVAWLWPVSAAAPWRVFRLPLSSELRLGFREDWPAWCECSPGSAAAVTGAEPMTSQAEIHAPAITAAKSLT
ncbi:hypothetical protein [Mycobacteroides abscessus]|uniref:hypothetical protein n=1 Tax=Mycobacteroides abscessus TaxID=36809 RepID=UPI0010424D36|nr:hypothetical protein [Mycobacteroides abscessus]MDO3031524.1 hypothetical protein [Mycobacteroides abscessus subsp. massiliense]MDO3217957.1 hypothetical protein [Mycobacteroides abscessus subsp. abscessus]